MNGVYIQSAGQTMIYERDEGEWRIAFIAPRDRCMVTFASVIPTEGSGQCQLVRPAF